MRNFSATNHQAKEWDPSSTDHVSLQLKLLVSPTHSELCAVPTYGMQAWNIIKRPYRSCSDFFQLDGQQACTQAPYKSQAILVSQIRRFRTNHFIVISNWESWTTGEGYLYHMNCSVHYTLYLYLYHHHE